MTEQAGQFTICQPDPVEDQATIFHLIEAAFENMPHSDGDEPYIVQRLQADNDLTLSLVAKDDGRILGHIAFSPVHISDGSQEWYGLGPVSVWPEFQRQRIGSALIRHGISVLQAEGARGIVLLGSPEYYRRFGFAHDPQLSYPGPPPEYFQRLVLAGEPPQGIVRYAKAFG